VKVDEPALKLSTEMFIGSVSSSAVQTSLSEHIIPYADMRGDSWGKGMLKAFDAAKQSHDTIKVLDGEPNMATYLMDNHQALLMESYGAASTGGSIGSPNVTMWFKSRAVHSIPAMTSFYNNARLRMIGYDDAKTVAWSHPLPKTQALLSAQMSGSEQLLVDFTVAITVLLAMGFIPASFVVYVVNEKSTNSKHQQLLTGVSPTMYWTTNYFFDILNFIIPLLVCFTLFVGFQVDAYSGRNLLSVTLLLFTYGLCMTPCMYCVEPFFKVPSTAYVALICTNIFTGTITVMTTTVLDMVVADDPGLKPLNDFFKAVFPWFFPNFNLGRGMIDIAANHYVNFAYDEFGVCMFDSGCPRSPLSWDAGGRSIFHLLMMAPFWFLLRLFIEWGFCLRTCRQRAKEVIRGDKADWERSSDDAVNDEADRVLSSLTCKGERRDQLLIHKLSKTFDRRRMCCNRRKVGPTYAVRGLNVGVPRGECFGLLGVNGAGKTTTMRMITGDTSTDGGDVQICGLSVHGKRTRARQHLGYCPQFDALPDKLTTRETIALYARIRGIPSALVQVTVNESIKRMCLESHQNTTCEHLSGGNKRKLSTAIALIGEPDVVLLDEPSTGVDVGARRFLWDIIGDIRKRGHALVLTSHSMEECEVLCTRLTIMVAGQFRCLGTPTQLKAKYGDGYTLTIKGNLSDDTDCMSYINEFVTQRLPGAVLAEESVGLARYNISSETKISLASMFTILEHAAKEKGELFGWISDYAISQTSLEEVFLHFAQDPTTPHIQGKAVDGCAPPSKESQNMDDVPLPTTKPNPLHIDHEKLDKEPNAKLDEEPDALVFM
jgi:ABC-type multidrug transport system ATPase subunit